MKDIKLFLLAHLILNPVAVFIIANDAAHPEHWDTWYRNPAISIPYCVALDLFMGCVLVYLWRKESRREKGFWLLKEALRLQSEGRHHAAEIAYREGCRLTGVKPR